MNEERPVAVVRDEVEAELIIGKLRAAGIEASRRFDSSLGLPPAMHSMTWPRADVGIFVRPSDRDRALRMLERDRAELPPRSGVLKRTVAWLHLLWFVIPFLFAFVVLVRYLSGK